MYLSGVGCLRHIEVEAHFSEAHKPVSLVALAVRGRVGDTFFVALGIGPLASLLGKPEQIIINMNGTFILLSSKSPLMGKMQLYFCMIWDHFASLGAGWWLPGVTNK